MERVILVQGLFDTVMPVSLPSVVGAVVGSRHSVLLASSTHFEMLVPSDKVHSMNM